MHVQLDINTFEYHRYGQYNNMKQSTRGMQYTLEKKMIRPFGVMPQFEYLKRLLKIVRNHVSLLRK